MIIDMKKATFQYLKGLVLASLLFVTYTAAAFYDPHVGRWLSRDPIGERGGVNLNGFVAENPVSSIDVLGLTKKCGVDLFTVKWRKGPGGLVHIDVRIIFKSGGDYDPKCCQYRQNAMTKFKVNVENGNPPIWEFDSSPLHYDSYSRSWDTDGNTSLGDPNFTVSDEPGIEPEIGPNDEIEYYEFTAEQIVYAPGRDLSQQKMNCDCEKNNEVAKKGPHTVKVRGKRSQGYHYEGVPAEF